MSGRGTFPSPTHFSDYHIRTATASVVPSTQEAPGFELVTLELLTSGWLARMGSLGYSIREWGYPKVAKWRFQCGQKSARTDITHKVKAGRAIQVAVDLDLLAVLKQ